MLGFVAYFFFAIIGLVLGGAILLLNTWIYHSPRWSLATRVIATIAYLLLIIAELFTVRVLRKSDLAVDTSAQADLDDSAMLVAGMSQATGPLPRRIIVGVVMAGNAALFIALGHRLFIDMGFVNPSLVEKVFAISLKLGVQFMMNVVSNFFLLVVIASVTQSHWMCRAFWKTRILLDFLLAAVIVSFAAL